jgi:hypothetical protein
LFKNKLNQSNVNLKKKHGNNWLTIDFSQILATGYQAYQWQFYEKEDNWVFIY